MSDNTERRITSEAIEIREEASDRYFEGYAFLYGARADLGSFTEEIAPGAADEVMTDDVRGLFNHDPNIVLGRNGTTMTLASDERGLKYKILFNPEDPDHVRVMAKVKRGDVSQSSFAFRTKEDKWEKRNGKDHRTLLKFKRLIDVSPVTYPAYPDATVGLRSLNKINQEKDFAEMDLEVMTRDLKLLNRL